MLLENMNDVIGAVPEIECPPCPQVSQAAARIIEPPVDTLLNLDLALALGAASQV